jgi:hypothetical protein
MQRLVLLVVLILMVSCSPKAKDCEANIECTAIGGTTCRDGACLPDEATIEVVVGKVGEHKGKIICTKCDFLATRGTSKKVCCLKKK